MRVAEWDDYGGVFGLLLAGMSLCAFSDSRQASRKCRHWALLCLYPMHGQNTAD